MSNKINDLAYNQKLSIFSIHFHLYGEIKNLFKSMTCLILPLISIRGNKDYGVRFCTGFRKRLSGKGFAKLSTLVGMGTYKHLRINPPFKWS